MFSWISESSVSALTSGRGSSSSTPSVNDSLSVPDGNRLKSSVLWSVGVKVRSRMSYICSV